MIALREECLICKAPLEYLVQDEMMECAICGKAVPGDACGFWGACGAGISAGQFMSIATDSTSLTAETFGLSNQMTAKALDSIGKNGGPRCCKRDSFLSIPSFVSVYFLKGNEETENVRKIVDFSTSTRYTLQ